MAASSSGHRSDFRDLQGLSLDLARELLFDAVTSDVCLRVQGDVLYAHRAILAARSPVFKAMFFGPMLESTACEVEVSTFSSPTMQLLLRFMYTGVVEGVPLEEMVPLMACADHYGMSSLRDSVSSHLLESISPETACTVLAMGRLFQQEHIQERYLSFILTHAQQVLNTEGFLNLDVTVLTKVLKSDEARIEEIELFKALVKWFRHCTGEPEGGTDEAQALALFRHIRYGQMTGEQLVTEVKPLAGDIVPQDLYIWALEQAAAPGYAGALDGYRKQCARRQPPVGRIQASDASFLSVVSTTVHKVGPAGWNCTAVVEPSTARTRFQIRELTDAANGIGVSVFDPERNMLRPVGSQGTIHCPAGFPNPNQWGADCLAGIYGTGCIFGIITEEVLRWQVGLAVEVELRSHPDGHQVVTFTTSGAKDGDTVHAEGIISVATPVKLAVALYAPGDKVSIESVW